MVVEVNRACECECERSFVDLRQSQVPLRCFGTSPKPVGS